MKEGLRFLVELQEIDSAINKKTAVINAIPQKLSAVEQALRDIQSVYEKHKLRCEALEKKKKDKERSLDDINDKIRKLKGRVSEIKTNKEYQAHLKEIESAEKERYAAEDEILSSMETLDTYYRGLREEEAKVKAEKEKIDMFKKRLEEEIAQAENEVSELKLSRERHVSAIDDELYSLYSKIYETGKGPAVVRVKNEICQGCNMNIPPQLYVEIKKDEGIMQCPHCDRILYRKEEG